MRDKKIKKIYLQVSPRFHAALINCPILGTPPEVEKARAPGWYMGDDRIPTWNVVIPVTTTTARILLHLHSHQCRTIIIHITKLAWTPSVISERCLRLLLRNFSHSFFRWLKGKTPHQKREPDSHHAHVYNWHVWRDKMRSFCSCKKVESNYTWTWQETNTCNNWSRTIWEIY